jgi:hypothetical protein
MRRQFLLGAGKHPARPSNIRSSIWSSIYSTENTL